jgi:hypothetical protein
MVAGPANAKYITLVSSDGFEFVVLRDAAMISPAIKGMLGPGSRLPKCLSAGKRIQHLTKFYRPVLRGGDGKMRVP